MDDAGSIPQIGGHPALDFANTAGWHAGAEPDERLTSPEAWAAWLGRDKKVPRAVLSTLAAEAAQHPARAARALRRIIARRELVYRIFAARARGRAPAGNDLAYLHRARLDALRAAEPRWRRGRYELQWIYPSGDLEAPVHPLMLAANELLDSPDLGRLRQCDNHPCGWLFLDRSKNGSRRWCSSAECGNATRVRNFRARR